MRETPWAFLLSAIALSVALHTCVLGSISSLHHYEPMRPGNVAMHTRFLPKIAEPASKSQPYATNKAAVSPVRKVTGEQPKPDQSFQAVQPTSTESAAVSSLTASPHANSMHSTAMMVEQFAEQALAEDKARRRNQSLFQPEENPVPSSAPPPKHPFKVIESNNARVEKVETPLGSYCVRVPNAAISHLPQNSVRLATVGTCP